MLSLDDIISTLRAHEGWEHYVYEDTLGNATIGCGRNIEVGGKGLTNEEITYLLTNDIEECITDLKLIFPAFSTLSPARQRSLISMRFQLGPTRFRKFEYTIEKINAGEFSLAAIAMRGCKAARQTKKRWEEIATWMEQG